MLGLQALEDLLGRPVWLRLEPRIYRWPGICKVILMRPPVSLWFLPRDVSRMDLTDLPGCGKALKEILLVDLARLRQVLSLAGGYAGKGALTRTDLVQ